MSELSHSLPVIDVSVLVSGMPEKSSELSELSGAVAQLGRACEDYGFFYVIGHGIDTTLQSRLENLSRRFFDQTLESKLEISMAKGGRAWRGYFPVGGELTSGRPDLKEGIYFGAELSQNHPSVKAGIPLHGSNLFPDGIPDLCQTVLEYMSAMTGLGHRLMSGIALSLGLREDYFAGYFSPDPLILFRIFNYPAPALYVERDSWGVGEHTDYGFLTILRQDEAGGLEVKLPSSRAGLDEWIPAPHIPGSFVCNIGDMLDRVTGGRYRSTPHRVRNISSRDRLSWPFFFDPNFDAEISPIDFGKTSDLHDDKEQRWDRASVHEFHGTYGRYLLRKVSRVFPELHEEKIGSDPID